MGWDESLFGYLTKKFSAHRRLRDGGNPDTQVQLSDHLSRLRLLACALTGESLEIREAEKFGGYRRSHIFLPARINLCTTPEQNLNVYLFRLVYSLTSRELNLALLKDEVDEGQVRTHSLLAIPETLQKLRQDLPMAGALLRQLGAEFKPRIHELGTEPWTPFLCLSCDWQMPEDLGSLHKAGSPMKVADATTFVMDPRHEWIFQLFGTLQDPGVLPQSAALPSGLSLNSLSSGTEKKAKPREHAEEVKLGEKKEDESPLVHVFEKVLTAEEYNGGKKSLDGSDDLEEHEEALDELNLRHVIRTRDRAHSIYKSDAMMDGGAPDLEDGETPPSSTLTYDEWDHSKRGYRRGWCTVHVSQAVSNLDPTGKSDGHKQPDHHNRTVRQLRAELEKLKNERRWKNRQIEGSELDFDALVERTVDLKAKQTPANRLFLSRRRTERDFSATILLDMSLSTDAWVDNRHVIQVARESVLILSEVLEGIARNVSVAGFYSNTRRDCRIIEFKGFQEPWSQFRRRLSALVPTGYTRIGPALRHCTSQLNETGTRKKLLLLVSDGKPSDYDRYEGTYGIQDVRQAIKEALQTGVQVRSLAIANEAKFYLPQMFGQGGYQILPHPTLLAPALSKFFAQCLK